MADFETFERTDVEWRRLNRVVWVGRSDGRHIGQIERGHDYVCTDGEGVVRGRFRDLASAQALFESPLPAALEDAADPRPVVPRLALWPIVVGGLALAAAAGASIGAMLLQ